MNRFLLTMLLLLAALPSYAEDPVPREKAGMASGTTQTTKQAGTALGVAVIGSLLVSGYHSALATGTRLRSSTGFSGGSV